MSIENGETYDPIKSLQEIKATPKTERQEKITALREQIAQVTTGLSKLGSEVIAKVEENPYIDQTELMADLVETVIKLHIGEEDKFVLNNILTGFINNHRAVREYYDANADDPNKMFEEIFGQAPTGLVEAIPGPACILFRCHDVEDYNYTFAQSEDTVQTGNTRAKESSGFMSRNLDINNVLNSVIVEKALGRQFSDPESQKVFAHEKQHVLDSYLMGIQLIASTEVIAEIKKAETDEERNNLIRHYFRSVRKGWNIDKDTGDELLAYLTSGESYHNTYTNLATLKSAGGIYDQFAEQNAKFYKDTGKTLEDNTVMLVGAQYREAVHSSIEQVFVTEHRELLVDGINSFKRLTSRGYSPEQAALILAATPLTKWQRETIRLTMEKEIDVQRFYVGVDDIVVAEIDGHLIGDLKIIRFEQDRAIARAKGGEDEIEIVLPTDNNELKSINYPFKTPKRWLELWERAGGEVSAVAALGIDTTSTEAVSASQMWKLLKKHSEHDKRLLDVFQTYIGAQRRPY